MMKALFFLVATFFCIGCVKQKETPRFKVSFRLFESSSNPVPVRNINLQLASPPVGNLVGNIFGPLEEVKQPDANGYVEFTYPFLREDFGPGGEYHIYLPNLQLYAWKKRKGEDVCGLWIPVTPIKNVHYDTLYLYKKIGRLVRKVKFNQPLLSGDSLEVITGNGCIASYKMLYGPIASGSVITADTVLNSVITDFDPNRKDCQLYAVLKKQGYGSDHHVIVPIWDEDYREIFLTY